MTLTEAYKILQESQIYGIQYNDIDLLNKAISTVLSAKDKYIQLANEVGVAVLLSKVQRGELSNSNAIAELVNNKFEKL